MIALRLNDRLVAPQFYLPPAPFDLGSGSARQVALRPAVSVFSGKT